MDVVKFVVEIVSLVILTVTEIAVFITNGLSGSGNASKFGFVNNTGDISDTFYTQITPAGFTFSIWGVIYTWEALWILYAWSFVFRPNTQRTIFVGVYWPRIVINCLNITWIYLFGNEEIVASCVILYLFAFTFYASNALLVLYFFRVQDKVNKIDKFLTYVLPINGMFLYNTWVTIASQLNLTIAIQYNANLNQDDSATIGLTVLLVIVITYFILEATIAERYLRYVFSVYPVLIWASIGVLSAHWKEEDEGSRNKIYSLFILIIATVFLVAKVVLCIVCGRVRPNKKLNLQEFEKIKTDEKQKYSQ